MVLPTAYKPQLTIGEFYISIETRIEFSSKHSFFKTRFPVNQQHKKIVQNSTIFFIL